MNPNVLLVLLNSNQMTEENSKPPHPYPDYLISLNYFVKINHRMHIEKHKAETKRQAVGTLKFSFTCIFRRLVPKKTNK